MLKVLAVFTYFFSTCLFAQPLVVGVSGTSANGVPEKIEAIKLALLSTGLELDIRVLPGERSIILLTQGAIAMDVYRQPEALAIYEDIIQIKPAVGTLEFWMITHSSTSKLCHLNKGDYDQYSVVGVRGARFFSNFIYDKFSSHEEVNNFSQVLKMVGDQRVDVSIWPIERLKGLPKSAWQNIHICDASPYVTLNFYSYIHKKYAWAIPVIEKAYRKHFPE